MTQRYVDVSYLADYNFDILCTFHISEKVSFKFKWAGTILGPQKVYYLISVRKNVVYVIGTKVNYYSACQM